MKKKISMLISLMMSASLLISCGGENEKEYDPGMTATEDSGDATETAVFESDDLPEKDYEGMHTGYSRRII